MARDTLTRSAHDAKVLECNQQHATDHQQQLCQYVPVISHYGRSRNWRPFVDIVRKRRQISHERRVLLRSFMRYDVLILMWLFGNCRLSGLLNYRHLSFGSDRNALSLSSDRLLSFNFISELFFSLICRHGRLERAGDTLKT